MTAPTVVATTSTLPEPPAMSFPSATRVDPSGRFCYVANRGPNTIAVFAVDGPDVQLIATVDAGGDYPWDMVLHGDYLYVLNQRSSRLTVFHRDPETGALSPTGTCVDVAYPVCILPVPA
jgi:6-phosphogluconolactonase (cycloisomerase 2 family)